MPEYRAARCESPITFISNPNRVRRKTKYRVDRDPDPEHEPERDDDARRTHGGQNWLSFSATDCGNDRVWIVEMSRHGEALSKIRYVNSSPAM